MLRHKRAMTQPTPKILCCGEALVDLVPGPDGLTQVHPGGGAFNTARALGRLGAAVAFFWPLSRDPHGQVLAQALTRSGVDITACPRVDRPTTRATLHLQDGQARYSFEDHGSAGRLLTIADLPRRVEGPLVFGGISLVAEPCGSAMEALFARHSHSQATLIDPNIRPAMIDDDSALRARLARMLPAAGIVKLSTDDLAWLTPDPAGYVRHLLDAGVRLVCLTDGARGVTAHLPGHSLHEPARPVQVVDTVGAGDTFNAGLLAVLQSAQVLSAHALRQLSPALVQAALRQGVAAATVTVSRPGADPPWAHEL